MRCLPSLTSPQKNIAKIELCRLPYEIDFEGGQVEVSTQINIWAGTKKFTLGGKDSLTPPELDWLALELSHWLNFPIAKDYEKITPKRIFEISSNILSAVEQPRCSGQQQYYMDARGWSGSDLEQCIGSRVKLSEILSRKRSLTLEMIRKLNQELGIPAEILIQPCESLQTPA